MSKFKNLTFEDRHELARRYRLGERVLDISHVLGVHPATIYNELKRGQTDELDENQRLAYDPIKAQRVVQANLRHRGRKG